MLAPALALFPQRLPTEEDTEAKRMEKEDAEKEEPGSSAEYVRDTWECAKRLAKNKVLIVACLQFSQLQDFFSIIFCKVYVFNSLSTICFLFGFIGFGTYAPKYFEMHFRRSTSSSGSSGGLSKAAGSIAGMLLSGFLLTK